MTSLLAFLMFQDDTAGNALAAGLGIGFMVISIAILVLLIAAVWKVFEKAGQPGWAVLIPFYNLYILLKIVGRPAWWIILFLIPPVTLIMEIIVSIDLANRFGKGVGFAIGLLLLPFIFCPLLAWGDARYQGAPAMA